MKYQLIKTFLILGLLLTQGLIYGQNVIDEKTRNKRIKKLWDTYSSVRVNNDCNAAIVGERILGGNDGGGRIPKGVSNIKIISLLDKKLTPWSSPYAKAHTMISNFKNDRGNLRILDDSNKVGLLNACKRVVLRPKYDEIGAFNDEGLAIAILNGKIDVIDLNGKSILQEPLKYNSIYESYNRNNRYKTIPNEPFPAVYKGTLIAGLPDKKFGVLNIYDNRIITEYSYEIIKSTPYYQNKYASNSKIIGYEAYRNGNVTIINHLGREIIKPVFNSLSNYYETNENIYVSGTLKNGEVNIYDNLNNKFLLPTDISQEVYSTKQINNELWMLEFHTKDKPSTVQYSPNYSKTGIYNVSTNKFIIEPNKEYKISNGRIRTDIHGFLIISTQGKTSKLFDYNGKLLSKNHNAKYSNFVSDKNQSHKFILVTIQPNPKSSKTICSLYKSNGDIVFENAEMNKRDIIKKADLFYIKESINCYPCEKVFTAFDLKGNMIGERRKYTPKE